ncbi:MAG TPA: hypothetical protein VF727_00160 [Allosphingosinicella sp.]|jgi:hypothetical protein
MDFVLEKIRADGHLGFRRNDPLFQVWLDGRLVGHVWDAGGSWCADIEPNLQPLISADTREAAAADLIARF